MAKITFLGAAGTVTGSKYLVEAEGKRLLVDCGLFQGSNELEQRNWNNPPVDPATIDWVVLTHFWVSVSFFPIPFYYSISSFQTFFFLPFVALSFGLFAFCSKDFQL